jgi:hypothetical protein
MLLQRLGLRFVGVLAVGAMALGCSPAPGNAQTERMITTVSEAIVYPRQDSAVGLARAASHTAATVFSAEDLNAATHSDPHARLGMRVRDPGREPDMFGLGGRDPVTACYMVEFNYYAATSTSRIACPADTSALQLPPRPPQPTIPDGADVVVEEVLEGLPARPADVQVRRQISRRMPAPHMDRVTGLRGLPPDVEVAVVDGDVGVALWEPSGRNCVLGSRLDDDVFVWRPSRVQMEPGELTCDSQTALARLGTRPPH